MNVPDEFDAAAVKVAGQTTNADPIDQAAAQVVQGQRTTLRSSLYGALLENPDVAARAQKLGRKTGLPADVVGRNLPEVERNAKLDEFDQLLQNSPVVAQWLADQNNAKVAHDDVGNMSALDTTLSTLGKAAKYLFSAPDAKNTLMGDVGAGVARASRGAAGVFQAAAEVPAPLLDWMEPITAVGGNPLRRLAEGFAIQGKAAEQTALSLSPKQDGIVAGGVSSGVQSLTQNLLTLPMAFLPGGQSAALYSMAGMTGGQSYQDAREKGLSMQQALPFATSQAVIEYATEKIPVSRLIGDLASNASLRQVVTRQLASEIPGEQIATVLQDLNEWAVLNPDKPFSAYLAERPSAAAQTLIATVVGTGGNIAVMSAVERATRTAEIRAQSAQGAEQRAQVVEQLNNLAAASKVRERDVDTFEQFIAQAAENGSVQHVYIDANTLMQSGMAEQLAQVSPSVAAQLQTAVATGAEIQIPVAEYTARIAGNEFAQSLVDDIRVEGEQFTRREAQEYMQNQAGELQAEVERVLAEKQNDEVFKASADTVKAEIKSQLDTVARFTPQVNEAYASMVGNFYAVMGAKIGATPEEVFAKYPLRVQAEAVQSGPVLEQGAPQDRNLIVAHNLTADNLRNALDLGGLPAPSLAITKVDSPIQGFGEITLVGDTKLAKPSAKNPVFNADVYSPRFPDVKVKVDDRKVVATLYPLHEVAKDVGLYAVSPDRVASEMGRNQLVRSIGDVVNDLGMRYGYAVRVLGKDIAVPMKTVEPKVDLRPTKGSIVTQEPLAGVLASIPEFGKTVTADSEESAKIAQALYSAMINRFVAEEAEKGNGDGVEAGVALANRRIKMFAEGEGESIEMAPGVTATWPERMTLSGLSKLWNAWRAQGSTTDAAPQPAQPRQEVDIEALSKTLDEVVDKDQMRQWVRDQLAPTVGEKRIVKEDGKTAAYSLQNIVKAMTGKVRDAEGFNYGLGNARSKGAKSFKSIADIQANRDQVKAKDEADAAIKEAEKRFSDLSDELDQYLTLKGSMYSPSSFEALADAIGLSYSQGIDSALSMAGFRDVPAETVKKVQEFASELTSLPTEYFEAKPQRAVGVDEFRGAVIPDTTPADVRNALADMGLTLVEYRKGDEASRAQAARTLAEQLDAETKDVLFQTRGANRGSFNPSTNTITLLKNADLSTFLHEAGHFFLEVQFDIASRLVGMRTDGASLSEGEQQIVDDADALLKWFGVESVPEWYSLDFEEKRGYHEKFARGFEAYLFEGKAPSIELNRIFQTFRGWLTQVYRNIVESARQALKAAGKGTSEREVVGKALDVQLSDEVRAVMDRMLATNEEIRLAEQARSMLPLFESPEQAGMTPEEFAAYQALGTQATADAIQDVQARTLRDLSWTRNARGREIKRLQKQSAELRREVQMQARREVMSQPIYRAWQFLTGKLDANDKLTPEASRKSDPNVVDPSVDSLFTAIAKLGGLSKDEVVSQWGTDPKDKPASGVFGKPVWRREGGRSIDSMAEALGELGYLPLDENGKADIRDLEERFDSELRGSPVYSDRYDYGAQQEQRAGDGVNVEALGVGRFDLTEIKAMGLPTEVVDRIQSLKMTGKVGLHPDIVADMFGFTSGDELVRTLATTESPKVAIEGLTDARMLEQYGELATPEAIERSADRAIHNEARARFVATEANALAKATGERKILASAAREFARNMIARLKVRDIRPNQYALAEARAAKAAIKASQSGDLVKAAAEKRNQLVNNYATRAAYDAQDEVDSGLRYLRKFDSDSVRKAVDADYVDQIDALLERFDLRKGQSLKAIDKRTALSAWVASQREQGFEPDIPAELENEAFRKSYKDMTVEEFRGLLDTVKQIEHLGRLKNRLLTAADNRAFSAVKVELVASIKDNSQGRKADTRTPTTNLGRALQAVKNFGASHIKAATWARIMDGGKDGGPMWEYLIRSANERGNMETQMRADATVELSRILAPVFKLGRMGGSGQFFPSIGRSLNREARLAIALNTGNQGNLQRLLGGEGWTVQQIQPVLQSLTAAEWQSVQAVWDHFESYRPQIGAKERRVYGREPEWVDPAPFTIKAADGVDVSLRGGYYPIKYDPAASQRAEEYADAEGAKRQLQGAFTSATTRRSFTKSRAEEVSGRPLLYTLSGLYGGVNDVIHDLAWHEWLIDANRILRAKDVDAAIREAYGPEVKQQFKTWAADIAEGEKGAQNAAEMALGRLRQGVSAAGLGFNVTSAAMQITGFNQSIVRVGAKWIGKGIAKYIASPFKTSRDVMGMSEFMADRSRTQFRELNELRNRVQDESATMRNIKLGTYFLMMRMQRMVDMPTWLGAYEKAIADGNAEERAVALADQAVIDSQGSGMTKDLSAVERGGPALKLFTVFYSYMNTALNMGVAQTMTAKSKGKLAADYLMLFTVPAVLGSILKDALTPGGDDDKDMEALARKLAAEQLSYLMGLMVVTREFGEVAKIVTGAEGAGRDYGGPAGLRAVGDTFRFAQQASQGEFDTAFRKASINVLGDLTGLPSAQINRTWNGIEALNEGETDNPAAVLFGYQKQ